jgi:YidC/Oxa1 family membrane protein insertase
MKTDKNTLIGFGLIILITIGYFWYLKNDRQKYEAAKKKYDDSIAATLPKPDPTILAKQKEDSARQAQQQLAQKNNNFKTPTQQEKLTVVTTPLAKYTFTNRGGFLKQIELLKYKDTDTTKYVELMEGRKDFGKFNDGIFYDLNTGNGQVANSAELFYGEASVTDGGNGNKIVSFTLADSTGKYIKHQFTINPAEYMVQFALQTSPGSQFFTNNTFNFSWNTTFIQHEKSHYYEQQQSQMGFVNADGFDYFNILGWDGKQFSKPQKWAALRQQFFTNAVMPVNAELQNVNVKIERHTPQDNFIYKGKSTMQLPLNNGNLSLNLYYGPNDYNIVKNYGDDFKNMVNLGQGIFSFVKYINRGVIYPIFNFFKNNIVSMGIIILLLTIAIRLITSPLIYKSFVSSAKMKALKPETDALREKLKDNPQQFSLEQMKLFRQAGVNPLGGCIPALLQMPIFISLYNFFNSNIELRRQSFLWAQDLSLYDSVLNLPFSIPFYGSHVSLFTLLTVITSFVISLWSMSMTPDQNNPALKYMPYIFPFMLLGFFNGLPSALTWYYFVSNVITLVMQIIIQKFIIKPEKILAQINVNKEKLKNKPKSKWQERIEQMQQSNQRMQDLRRKIDDTKKKK